MIRVVSTAMMVAGALGAGVWASGQAGGGQPAQNPRQQPGAAMHIYAPEQHDLYDGRFVVSANRIHMIGGLNDPEGWDHLDNEAKSARLVSGTAEIDVDEIRNTGTFVAKLRIPEGDFVMTMDRWHEFSPSRTAGSSPTCTSMAPIRAAATTTGRRPSGSWPGGATATPR